MPPLLLARLGVRTITTGGPQISLKFKLFGSNPHLLKPRVAIPSQEDCGRVGTNFLAKSRSLSSFDR